MQEEETTQPATKLGFGILSVDRDILADAIHLPEGYTIVGMQYNPGRRTLELTLMSDALPHVPEGQEIPRVSLIHTRHSLPEYPRYHYITAEVQIW